MKFISNSNPCNSIAGYLSNGDEKLSLDSREKILQNANTVFVSIASFWEIAIKINIKKLSLKSDFEYLFSQYDINNFQLLNIQSRHLLFYVSLPLHHRDPFDRILIAQAISEKMTIVTRDPNFSNYDVRILW